jgi:hypothetical protein
MSNNLCQNGLGLVPKRIVGRLEPMGRELEWLIELPLEVQLQAHWDLITSESGVHNPQWGWSKIEAANVHVLCRQLKLIFAKSVETTQCDIWVSNTVLSSREKLEVISRLQNRTIVRRNVQTERMMHRPSSVQPYRTGNGEPSWGGRMKTYNSAAT